MGEGSNIEDPTTAYASAVVAGEIVAGKLVRLACARHLRDLEQGAARGIYFDAKQARRAFRFFGMLRHTDGQFANKIFQLHPYQQFVIGSLFGWKKADGSRRFIVAYIEIGKGNGKTPLAAGVGLYGLVADGEAGAQIYSAAVTRDQAMLSFVDAENMAKASPEIADRIDFNVGNMAVVETNSFFRAISSEKRGLDGKRVHIALIDELHEHPSGIVVDKMRAGTKSRRQALIFEITNSGYDRTTVCWQHHEYSAQVLGGILEDDGWFAYVCQLDPCEKCAADGKQMPTDGCPGCDQWTEEATWIKANPGLDVILTRRYLAGQVKEAQGMPTKENIVRRLNFCQWTEQDVRWIPMADWDSCPKTIDLEELAKSKRRCWGGLDLSATNDYTAFLMCFPPLGEDDPWIWVPKIWVPGVTAEERERRDRLPITTWARQGLISVTEGNVVDYDFVIKEIEELGSRFAIQDIGYDSWNATQAANELGKLGFVMVEMRQGTATLNEPCKMLEKLVRSHQINHGGHQVMRWMASNVVVRVDANGNLAPDKEKSGQKIDGIVAGLMAMGRAIRCQDEPCVYNSRGFLSA